MENWTRREVLRLGALAPLGFAPLSWAQANTQRNLALNRAAWASSSADFINTAHMATDGQTATGWLSANADPQWIYLDLGAVSNVNAAILRWGDNHALSHRIQVSSDSGPSLETGYVENWTEIHRVLDGKGGVEQIPLPATNARYVRLLLSQMAKPGGYHLCGFEVYGLGGFEAIPTPIPAAEQDGTTLRLSAGWRLVNQAYIPDEAPAISTCGYDDSKWLIATVPGTVLTSYQNLGAVPNMFYGDHQLQVSDFFAHTNWWYRNEVALPPDFEGRRVWLNFDGINYRAYVFVNGRSAGRIDGAFIRGRFDISDLVARGKKNCIAVLIKPVPKPWEVSLKGLKGFVFPHEFAKNEPTFLASDSWDWLPTIRDRNTGLCNHVTLTSSGGVTVRDPFVTTVFPRPQDVSRADITIRLDLKNHEDHRCKGVLTARLGEIEVTQSVALEPGETRSLALDKSTHPRLSLEHPKLWWPTGYGEQNLLDLTLEFKCAGKVSDINKSRFGIRQYTYNQPSLTEWDVGKLENPVNALNGHSANPLIISCNGRRIFIRGVNWGMSEGMLRCDRKGFETRVRMEKEMNFNLIRNWAGNLDKPEFFEICDELGIMVWEEFGISSKTDPDDPIMWLTNARDRFLRRRNHACVVLWCSANETIPIDPILTEMPKMAKDLDGTRLFLHGSTQVPPTEGDGPYETRPPQFYFGEFARGFRPELGSPTVPAVESMRRMMPYNKLWPINDLWGMHDWWSGAGWTTGNGLCGNTEAAVSAYGPAAGIEDFCRTAQMVNMEVFKAIYEAWNDRMWGDCTGVMIWMSNPAWPSLTWNTYDYYGEPTAAYFACRTACEPVHIQWNINSNSVKVVNCTANSLAGLKVQVQIYNLDGSVFLTKSVGLDCPANSVREAIRLFTSGKDGSEGLSSVHFIKLGLKDSKGASLSSNFYWRAKSEGKYEEMRNMAKGQVTGAAGELKNGRISVDLRNSGPGVVVMARLKLVNLTTGLLAAPVFYSDNYISMVPGESRRIDIDFDTSGVVKNQMAALVLEGWNLNSSELARIRI